MSINYQFLVVEDDVLIAEDIKQLLKKSGIENVLLAHSFQEAIQLISIHNPDFALLDIRMERELDGFEIAQRLNEDYQIPFMYVTSHSDEVLVKKIIKSKPIAYVTKPINKFNFFAQIQLALSHLNDRIESEQFLKVKDGLVVYNINVDKIHSISADGNYLNLYTEQGRYNTRMSSAEILEKLPENFVKIHRSHIVNVKKVNSYTTTSVKLENEEIPISRGMKDQFFKVVKRYLK